MCRLYAVGHIYRQPIWQVLTYVGLHDMGLNLSVHDLAETACNQVGWLETWPLDSRANFRSQQPVLSLDVEMQAIVQDDHHHHKCLVPGLQQTGSAWQYKSQRLQYAQTRLNGL